jgi:hypothetical protein
VYTAWKRVYVERDRMFRRGGVLYQSYGSTLDCGGEGQPACSCGGAGQPPCCGTAGQPPCNQIVVYDWTNASDGDTIVVFDETQTYESGGETRTITAIAHNGSGLKTLTLNAPLAHNYLASGDDGQNPPHPTFANGHSAGFGVTHSADGQVTDPSANQLNGPGSAFYDADLRDVKQPFTDAYVEVLAPREGMGAVPYVGPATGIYASGSAGRSLRAFFSSAWFQNGPIEGNNYIHLVGVCGEDAGLLGGDTLPEDKESMIFVETWQKKYPNPAVAAMVIRAATDHELVHQFYVNACAVAEDCSKQAAANHHDFRPRWTATTAGCPAANANPCLMDPAGGDRTGATNRLCKEDLLLGDPVAPCSYGMATFQGKDTALRTVSDPLPMSGVPGGP